MADDRQLTRDPPSIPHISGLPDSEIQYWRDVYTSEPYFEEGRQFEDYSPAYEIGWIGYHNYGGEFDIATCVMATDWTVRKGVSSLLWEQARAASRAAWQRAENAREFTSDGSATTEETLATLNELLQDARDCDVGFHEAAEHMKSPDLNALYLRCAQNCRESAAELQEQIERLGGQVGEGGSVGGAAHRVWTHIRGLFGGTGVPNQCEPGEDAVLGRYRKALKQNLSPEIHAVVQRQFERAQRNCDMVKSLCDRGQAQAQGIVGA